MMPIGETTGKVDGDRHLPVVLYLAPWAFVVLAALRLKHRLLVSEGGGYDFLAEVLGVGNAMDLNPAQRLAMFRFDVLVAVVIGSIAFLGIMRLVRPRQRAWVAWLISLSLFLLFYAQLKSWWEVGTFISAKLMAAGLFGPGRELISEYATSASVQKLLLSLVVITVICSALAILERYETRLRLSRLFDWTRWPLTVAAAAIVIASWTAPIPHTPFDRAATMASLAAFVGRADYARTPPNLEGTPTGDLITMYARMANAPVPNRRSAYFGKARGYDVVFMLMETTPLLCYKLAFESGVLPAMRDLSRNSLVADAHYATYPYSRNAYESIFASWYPPGKNGDLDRLGRISTDLRAPGVVHSTAISGYETAAFVPERPMSIEEDELRYATLGFADHEVPPAAYERAEGLALDNTLRGWVRVRDRQSFDQLKQRVANAIDEDSRFLYSFNPQITHGPWPGIQTDATPDETCRAGFPLLAEIDTMVGELVSLLREKQRLDKTLIVLVGDHGLRTRSEYPPFHAGTLDDVVFHVPFMLYAPGIFPAEMRIPWMTSHVDIAPSVLDLLGIDVDRQLELGSPMWNNKLADRATFFFAKGYLGADGYQRANRAVMVRYLYGGVSASKWNGKLQFQTSDLMQSADDELYRDLDNLTTMSAIQVQLSRTMLPSLSRLRRPPEERRGSADVRIATQPTTPEGFRPD